MPSNDRDTNIVRHILKYCNEVRTAHDDFDIIWETSHSDISALRQFCETYLAQNNM